MIYIGNAFSLQMVQEAELYIRITDIHEVASEVSEKLMRNEARFCIGHQDVAAVAAEQLNEELNKLGSSWFNLSIENTFKRVNVQLNSGDVLYVLQVVGGRLPEGCTELPEGIQLVWKRVVVR